MDFDGLAPKPQRYDTSRTLCVWVDNSILDRITEVVHAIGCTKRAFITAALESALYEYDKQAAGRKEM